MQTGPVTNPSIFLRLQQTEAAPRELAWNEFHSRYAPMITAFAQRLGLAPQDVDDVVQDVMLGFYSKSPTFTYDPSKGRFRGYLKVCTHHAAQRRRQASKDLASDPSRLDEVAIDHLWEDVWEAELLRRTVEELRTEMGSTKAFQAFEQHVMFERPADAVATALQMHLNSVYRAKDQIVQILHQRLADRRLDVG
jgi:RNA polymerase sigma-70 factor (ECF subfamily)